MPRLFGLSGDHAQLTYPMKDPHQDSSTQYSIDRLSDICEPRIVVPDNDRRSFSKQGPTNPPYVREGV